MPDALHFKQTFRIYYDLTDAGGVMYHANYIKLMERARSDALLEKGFCVAELARQNIVFVVKRIQIDYKYPAKTGDIIELTSTVQLPSPVRSVWDQTLTCSCKQLCHAQVTIAHVDQKFKPKRLPDKMMQVFLSSN
ncbi:acyl-CoA thioesterase [Gammaproteobacteria bacterium]|nr:acyl-CoA thioesterase [Gammaproteobacteria bacterium]